MGDEVVDLQPFDLVRVPPFAWHQFRPQGDAPLGFLCLVDRERDAPRRPNGEELAELRSAPEIAAFIRV